MVGAKMIDGKEFYNKMHRDHPDRWEVPNGGHHAFDLNVKNIVHGMCGNPGVEFRDPWTFVFQPV